MLTAEPTVLIAAFLLLAGVLLSKTSARWGVPSLLLFLLLGMLAGSEGLIGVWFDDFELSRDLGVIALAIILFSGGLSTRWADVRQVLAPGVALASVGTLASALVLGSLAAAILQLGLLEGMLLGAIIASTDAAAVFSILRSRGVVLRDRLRSLLELESGSNDPAAVFLTVGIITLIQQTGSVPGLVGSFFWQMGLGLAVGWLLALAAVTLINRINLEYHGLYPLLTLSFALLTYEGATWLGGSGFLAAYVAGLVMARANFVHKGSLLQFHDSLGWLMQIAMFVVLGLLVFPSNLLPVAGQALLVAALLTLVARPASVVLTLAPFRIPPRQLALVSWVGLRGAAPIILATFPVVEGVAGAERIFNVVFFVVLTSVLVQGTTIPAVARRLGLAFEPAAIPEPPLAGEGGVEREVPEVTVTAGAPADGRTVVQLDLPAAVLLVLVRRADERFMPQGSTRLLAGDRVLVVADNEEQLQAVVRILRGADDETGADDEAGAAGDTP